MSGSAGEQAITGFAWRGRALTLFALIAYIAIYSLVTYGGVLEGVALLWWNEMAWTIISLAAGLKCLHTARFQTRKNERRAWYAFGIAALLWFGGMLVWDYMELVSGAVTPYPSGADVFYLGFAVAFIVGIFYYRDTRSTRYVSQIQFSNLGIIVCTVIIVTSVILYPQIKASEESYYYIGFSIAYAVVFMSAVIFGLFSCWFYVWTTSRKVFPLMLLALFIHAVADTLYAFELLGKTYGASNYLNVFWIVAFAVQYWAATVQDSQVGTRLQRTDGAGMLDGIQKLEGIAPSLSMLTVLLTLWVFGQEIDYEFLKFVFAVAMVLMVFLVMREWSMSRALTHARNTLEEQVKQRTLQLTQINRDLEAYSYSIAHDLRAPLRAVTGFSQILMDDAREKLNPEERDSLNRIANAGIYMATLIDEILDLARVSRVEMHREPVDISALSEQVVQRLTDSYPGQNVTVSIQPGMRVTGDPQLLKQALENLIGNALKYSSTKSDARVDIGATRVNGEAVHYVRDNGVGFEMQYYKKLFEPFQRLHNDEEFPGTGVGLATVQRIVERHGGRLWAEGEPDKGATFYMALPVS